MISLGSLNLVRAEDKDRVIGMTEIRAARPWLVTHYWRNYHHINRTYISFSVCLSVCLPYICLFVSACHCLFVYQSVLSVYMSESLSSYPTLSRDSSLNSLRC